MTEAEDLQKKVDDLQKQLETLQASQAKKAVSYRAVKKIVLVVILGGLFFMFGYLYMGDWLGGKLGGLFHPSSDQQAAQQQQQMGGSPSQTGGPPGPVMQQIQALKARIAQNPKDGDAYSQLGDLYFEANMYKQALQYYQSAVNANGKDLASRNDLAICDHLTGKDKAAFDELNTALKMDPNNQHLWLTLGVISYETGARSKASDALEKAYNIDPTSDAGTKAKSMLASLNKK